MSADGGPVSPPARRLWSQVESDVGLSIILAIQVVVFFIVAPLAAMNVVSAQLTEALRFGLAAITILVVSQRPVVRWAVSALFSATLFAMLYWHLGRTAVAIGVARGLATLAFDVVVAGIIAVATFRPGRINVHRIMGAVILYLYIGLIFAAVYRILLPFLHPNFSGLTAGARGGFSGLLDYSLGALTTSGDGSVVAVHPILRSLSSLESVVGQLFPATLLARLVSLHVAGEGERPMTGETE